MQHAHDFFYTRFMSECAACAFPPTHTDQLGTIKRIFFSSFRRKFNGRVFLLNIAVIRYLFLTYFLLRLKF